VKVDVEYGSSKSTVFDEASTKPSFDFGAGYQFNHRWAVEARFNTTKWSVSGPYGREDANLNHLSVTANFRF